MIDIELQTQEGEFVATVEILPFAESVMPDMVRWGSRTFVYSDERTKTGGMVVYREGFMTMSFTPSPGKPKKLRPT